MREHKALVPWSNVVWLKKGIPKQKLLTWLFVLNRCPTRDRLISWGISIDPACLLCNDEAESRNHLFFECDFTRSIWWRLSHKLRLPWTSGSWDTTLQILISFKGTQNHRFLILLAWQSLIYETWRERNNRLHRHIAQPSEIAAHPSDNITQRSDLRVCSSGLL
ncbi:unnamed protein product [Arabis nemorensis]|uniref:Reverse transcriptase zinc-binding domain-containing protein n=1 Tax=Arabis nemorensis TaxID=586526 RepID=A0A565BVK0_9BRAS|nr:unnamed protein product [Arabis nemorensis]